MAQRHSTPIRGLMSTKRSPLFQGRFGRLFRSLPPATFGSTDDENVKNLTTLGLKMSAGFDPPKDGKDDEESGIPALYTYLGQFIDHDLTFDPASSLQMRDDPDALTDFRTPAFDLDNIYGRGPDDQPYMYDGSDAFLLGSPITGATRKPRICRGTPPNQPARSSAIRATTKIASFRNCRVSSIDFTTAHWQTIPASPLSGFKNWYGSTTNMWCSTIFSLALCTPVSSMT